ncbi:MAG TPA: FAD binding domain-containing protein [Anaerolineales bacterium]|nr:FAD binding domain-containing protein [Anaerolineales bacterium]
MWRDYHSVISIEDAIRILADQGTEARIIAGATDLMLEMERGVRKGINALVDITRINGMDQIYLDEDNLIHLGPLVTHGQCAASKIIIEQAFPLARACWEVGAPQIRNRGTIAGNLITASPANDTIPPLMALNANVVLQSVRGRREIPLAEFYTGVRTTIMRADEVLVDIYFPALARDQRGSFYKLGLRKVQAISLVNCAIVLTFDGERVKHAAITLGSVAPVIVHASEAEEYLQGRILNDETIGRAAELAKTAARPIDDIRSTHEYRSEMVRVCVKRVLTILQKGEEKSIYPKHPVLLRACTDRHGYHFTDFEGLKQTTHHIVGQATPAIETKINSKEYKFTTGHQKSLLRLLREEAGLIGTKEGCAEGDCGACTVFLDGMAVMSCMVPAVRAHGAHVVTIEGIMREGKLHPVQQAFIDQGAVQCGYCTPGFIMSSVMLLDEIQNPSRDEIKEAISGNLCRCTGYYSIVSAVEQAATNSIK